MRRQKVEATPGGFGGDWSESGTFLRKPASGWLHEDSELMDNSCINYQVEVWFSKRARISKVAVSAKDIVCLKVGLKCAFLCEHNVFVNKG